MNTISKSFVFTFFICLLLFFGNTGAYSQQLTIAVEDDAAPWSQKDGTGYANDIVKAAFKAVGINIKLEVVPYSRARDMVISGKTVACFSMSWHKDFKGKVIFSKIPLFECSVDYYTTKSNLSKINDQYDLKEGTVVGTVLGYEYPPVFNKLVSRGILKVEKSESEITNIKKLASERLKYILLNCNETKPAALLIAHAKANGKIVKAFHCGKLNSHIGFSTKHPQGSYALNKFNEGMQLIIKNGTLKKIEEKWKIKALTEIQNLSAN